jgi:hypothetical protein
VKDGDVTGDRVGATMGKIAPGAWGGFNVVDDASGAIEGATVRTGANVGPSIRRRRGDFGV